MNNQQQSYDLERCSQYRYTALGAKVFVTQSQPHTKQSLSNTKGLEQIHFNTKAQGTS